MAHKIASRGAAGQMAAAADRKAGSRAAGKGSTPSTAEDHPTAGRAPVETRLQDATRARSLSRPGPHRALEGVSRHPRRAFNLRSTPRRSGRSRYERPDIEYHTGSSRSSQAPTGRNADCLSLYIAATYMFVSHRVCNLFSSRNLAGRIRGRPG